MALATGSDGSASSDQQAPDLRQSLLEAGRDVFAEMGYDGATVHDIISRASTSRATFYRYFSNKDELFWRLAQECFRDMNAVMTNIGRVDHGESGRVELERLLRSYSDLYSRHRGVIRAWFERQSGPPSRLHRGGTQVFGSFVETLTGSIDAAGTSSVVDPRLEAALIFIAINRSHEYVTSRYSKIEPERLVPTLANLVHRAYFGA